MNISYFPTKNIYEITFHAIINDVILINIWMSKLIVHPILVICSHNFDLQFLYPHLSSPPDLLKAGTWNSPTTFPSSKSVSREPWVTRSVAVACVPAPAIAFSPGRCGDRITNGRWRARVAHKNLQPVRHGLFSTWCAKPSVEHLDSNSAPYIRSRKP